MMDSILLLIIMLVLTGLFVFLKLTGRVRWSWLWVVAPLWLPPLLGILAAILLPIILKAKG